MSAKDLDDINRTILKAKVANPDLTTTAISELVGLSQSAVSKRIRSKEFQEAYKPYELNVARLKEIAEKKAWRTLIKNMGSKDERIRNSAASYVLTALGKDPDRQTVSQNNLYIFKTSISGDGTITNEKIEKPKGEVVDVRVIDSNTCETRTEQ